MKRTLIRIGIACVVVVFGMAALSAVVHREPNSRSEHEWVNLYPNGASKVYGRHRDTTFAAAEVGTLRVYNLTEDDSLYRVTKTTISINTPRGVATVDPETYANIIFYYGAIRDTGHLIVGESFTYTRVFDSLDVVSDSARARVWPEGHALW